MAAPMIPALNDHELEAILAAVAERGATSASYILLRLPLEIKELFAEWLEDPWAGSCRPGPEPDPPDPRRRPVHRRVRQAHAWQRRGCRPAGRPLPNRDPAARTQPRARGAWMCRCSRFRRPRVTNSVFCSGRGFTDRRRSGIALICRARHRPNATVGPILLPDLSLETEAGAPAILVAGVDEAGRGPLAGPVVSAAVVLPANGLAPDIAASIDDSKALTARRREHCDARDPGVLRRRDRNRQRG